MSERLLYYGDWLARSRSTEVERAWRWMRLSAALFVFGYFAHFADHLARGLSLTPGAVLVAGSVGAIPGALAVVLVTRRHPLAPLLACVTGASFAVAFIAVHVPPKWGPLSEPFRSGVIAWDWMSLALGILGGLAFALAGARALALAHRSAAVKKQIVTQEV